MLFKRLDLLRCVKAEGRLRDDHVGLGFDGEEVAESVFDVGVEVGEDVGLGEGHRGSCTVWSCTTTQDVGVL